MRLFKHYISWKVFFLFITEALLTFGSVYIIPFFKCFGCESFGLDLYPIYPKALLFTFISLLTFYVANIYDLGVFTKKRELYSKILSCFIIIAFIIPIIGFIFPYLQLSRKAYILSLVLSLSAIIVFRTCYYWAINVRKLQERVLILGATEIAWRISEELHNGTHPGFEVLGFVAENEAHCHRDIPDDKILGGIDQLGCITHEYRPDIMVIALSERRRAFPAKDVLDCKLRGVRVEDWPTFYEKLTGKILIQNLRPSWLIFADGFTRNTLMQTIKRLIDMLLSAFGLCVSLPFMAMIAALVKLDSAGPILFCQERVGENGKIFTLRKFRTMVADAEKDSGPVWAQTTDPRVTRLGKIMRRTGMDELPQLFNVLIGDMSFVGPRPERPHFVADLEKQIPYYTQRLAVKPGITGWAQVRYGYGATLDDAVEKLQYDLYYIKNMSIFLDLLTMLSTVHKVLFAKVAVQSSIVGATPFPFPPAGVDLLNFTSILDLSAATSEAHVTERELAEVSHEGQS